MPAHRLKCLVVACMKHEGEGQGGVWVMQAFWETLDQAQLALTRHLKGHDLDTPTVVAAAPAPAINNSPCDCQMKVSYTEKIILHQMV